MKKLSLLTLAAAGLLMVGCSDKDVVVDNTPQNLEEFKDGAYLGISLQLPEADRVTRANDSLSNGIKEEFAVMNATLYIFKIATADLQGTTPKNPDEDATFVGYVSLGTKATKDDQPGINEGADGVTPSGDVWGVQNPSISTHITSTISEATQIPNALASQMKADNTNQYYAYVIVNHNGQVPALSDGSSTTATKFGEFSRTQFNQIGADIAAEQKFYESGLLMTSSPICSEHGGSSAPADGAKYTTLVELDKSKIFGNKADAEKNPAACVYVERAAAKITVVDGRGTDTRIGDLDVAIQGWQVINNEPTYYNTRQINNSGTASQDWGPYNSEYATNANTKWRFVSLGQFNPTLPTGTQQNPMIHTRAFRTYFAKDVQYDANATLANTVASDARPWIPMDHHAYTTENTFDVAHQTWQNTTMVTLKVKIGDGTTPFYTVGKGSQTMYTTVDDVKAAIQNVIKNDPVVTTKYNTLLDKISENNPNTSEYEYTVTAGLKVEFTAPTTGTTDVKFTVVPDYKITTKTIATSAETTADAGYNGNGEAELKTALETAIRNVMFSNPEETDQEKLKTADAVLLSCYVGGLSYYNARIKHFGDFETPWSASGPYISGGGKDVKEIYAWDDTDTDKQATANNRFLGRYGVVRDNWYKLSIDKIGKIGTAEPVDPSKTTPDTPDDEIENFISVHVHIVPWVLREQSVQF